MNTAPLRWFALACVASTLLSACTRYEQSEKTTGKDLAPSHAAGELQNGPSPEAQGVSKFKLNDQAQVLGVNFVYRNGEEAELFSIVESLGGGVGMIDFDLDGRLDLIFPGGGTFTKQQTMPAHANGLFRNLGERFENVAEIAGVEHVDNYSHGVDVADFDNDGFPDFVVSSFGGLTLFHNQGDGTFQECDNWNNVSSPQWCTSLAWGDYSGDGNLDLYVARYVNWSFANNPVCKSTQDGPRDICPPKSFAPLAHMLLVADGEGNFVDASSSFGLAPDGKGLGVLSADFDNDQDIDIYVANDTTNNFLYLNEQGKRFTEVGLPNGVAVDEKGLPNGSMGISATDFDNNGWIDLWVANYEREAFALYRNAGDAQFTHLSRRMGITTSIGGAFVGFGTEFVDLNNDGVAEIVVANGHVIHHPAAAPYRQTPLLLSLTNGRFQRDLFPDNNYFGMSHLGRGLAVGDLNNDRRQDVVISHINEPVAVLINATEPARKPLRIRLIGTSANRDAIGARVVVQQGDDTRSYQIIGGGSYLSRSERVVSHSRAVPSEDLVVTVYWPNASRPQATNVEAKLDQLTIIEEK